MLKSQEALVEGEVVAVDEKGRPLPFQDLMHRFRRIHKIEKLRKEIPLKLYLFDILYINGKTLVERAYEERWNLLEEICPTQILSKRLITLDKEEAERFLAGAIKSGHEGIMVKKLNSRYELGKRGKKWLKVKTAETIDAVIIAAEWGHGRREGWLSNYHLGVRDEKGFQMIGKTFKGLSDKEFKEMTEKLKKISIYKDGITVYVRPEVVVEVTYSEIQKSPHYNSGYALRFARITKIREDLSPQDCDTIERLKELYLKQFKYKGKLRKV
jgi:DNA ligase-1